MTDIERLFVQAWFEEEYRPGDTLPSWVELERDAFLDTLRKFIVLMLLNDTGLQESERHAFLTRTLGRWQEYS